MKYNFDEIIDRKNNHATKYNELIKKFGVDDVIPLWIADMDFRTAEPVVNAVRKKAEHGIFGYVYRPDEYFESFINWQKKRFGWEPKKELLSFSIGIVPALGALVRQFSEKGDKILIQTPVYSEFYDINLDNERVVIENRFIEKDGVYSLDLKDLEEKLKEHPKLLIFCNPQNPIGHVWTYEELKSIGDLCVKYNVPVISDEIHADLTLWDNKHIPMASVSEEIRQNTITCTSTGKAFNVAGLQCATIVFNNLEENDAIVFMGHGSESVADITYQRLQEEYEKAGKDNIFVATVEGKVTIEDVIQKLKGRGFKKILLKPFMIVAGDHAKNDMASDEDDSWKTVLENEGYEVTPLLKGMGEYQFIRKMFMDKLEEVY